MKSVSVKKNLIYNFVYQILAILQPLITTPYISRVLGPTRTGEYSYSYAIAYYFVMITMLGLNNYGNRTIAVIRDDKDKLSMEFWSIYIMQLTVGIISSLVYLAYGILFSNKLMTWILFLYVLSAIFDINWFFFGMEQFRITVTRNTIIKIITTICVFVFVKDQNDIYKYALIMVSGIFISQLILWKFLFDYVVIKKICFAGVIKHIKPNVILFIPILAVSLYKVMDKIMLGVMTTKTEVGLYESSERIIQIPMALIQSTGTVMLPKMSNLFSKRDSEKAKNIFSLSIMLVMFLSSSMCFGIMGVARYFVPLYYGKGYLKCIDLFQILLPSCIFLAFANVIRTQYLIPKKKDAIFISSVVIGSIINLIINCLLIPKKASIGAAIGTLLAEVAVCVYQTYSVRKDIEIFLYIKNSLLFVIPAVIMYLILDIIDLPFTLFVNLLFLIIIGLSVYIIILLLLLIITHKLDIILTFFKKEKKI